MDYTLNIPILQSDYFSDKEHLALNQVFSDLEYLQLEFNYSLIKNDIILGFEGFPEFEKLSQDKQIKAILGIKRKNPIEKENTFLPIFIVEENFKQKDETTKKYVNLTRTVYKVPLIEYKNNNETGVRGFVYKEDSFTIKFENILDACNIAIQRYEELYYHYYWTHHITKISDEFQNTDNLTERELIYFIEKVKELDQFNLFDLKLVDNHALLTCDKLRLHKSFDIKSTIREPKDHLFKLRDITIKHLKNETDIIFKIIMVDFLTMS